MPGPVRVDRRDGPTREATTNPPTPLSLQSSEPSRPWGVTILGWLQIVGGAITVVRGAVSSSFLIVLIYIVGGIIGIYLGRGLLRGEGGVRHFEIVLLGLGMIGGVFGLFALPPSFAVEIFVSLAASALVIYYLTRAKVVNYFEGPFEGEYDEHLGLMFAAGVMFMFALVLGLASILSLFSAFSVVGLIVAIANTFLGLGVLAEDEDAIRWTKILAGLGVLLGLWLLTSGNATAGGIIVFLNVITLFFVSREGEREVVAGSQGNWD